MGLFGNLPTRFGFPIYSGSGSVVPYSPLKIFDHNQLNQLDVITFQNITMMEEYSGTSQEELRYTDYLIGRQGIRNVSKYPEDLNNLTKQEIIRDGFAIDTQTSGSKLIRPIPGVALSSSVLSSNEDESKKSKKKTVAEISNIIIPKLYSVTVPHKKSRIELPSGESISCPQPFIVAEKPLKVRKFSIYQILGEDSANRSEINEARPVLMRKGQLPLDSSIQQRVLESEEYSNHEISEYRSNSESPSESNEETNDLTTTEPVGVVGPSGVTLNNPKMFIRPNLYSLDKTTIGESCLVTDFIVGHQDYGEVMLMGIANVFNADLDETFKFTANGLSIYQDDVTKDSPFAHGFDRPAMITLYNIWPYDAETKQAKIDAGDDIRAAITSKLLAITDKFQGKIVSYDDTTGSLVFRVQKLQIRYRI